MTFTFEIPYFFCYDRVNYARWAIIYYEEMELLPRTAPEVYREFMAGSFTVKRSDGSFNRVAIDMALEQSLNCDAALHGGIIGLTQNQEATVRWFLTEHKRAEMMHLCGMEERSSVDTKHTEYGAKRMTKDEKDVQALTSTILQMTNPFLTHELPESDALLDEYQNSLLNISTGIVADSETQSDKCTYNRRRIITIMFVLIPILIHHHQ